MGGQRPRETQGGGEREVGVCRQVDRALIVEGAPSVQQGLRRGEPQLGGGSA